MGYKVDPNDSTKMVPEGFNPTAKQKSAMSWPLDPMVGANETVAAGNGSGNACLLYTSPSPRDATLSRMPSSA